MVQPGCDRFLSRWIRHCLLTVALVSCIPHPGSAQEGRLDRVPVDGQALWLNGGNVAWVNFARDIGPGETRLDVFERIFREMHENGGNTMRLWLHTTGAVSPAWNGEVVVGPGEGATLLKYSYASEPSTAPILSSSRRVHRGDAS